MQQKETISHLLIVDDDRRIRELLRHYLVDHGFNVTTAHNTSDARYKMDIFIFDLLILDVMMPGEDGFMFTKRIRESSIIPILLLTAKGESEDRISGLELGADDYLLKPFEPRELLLRVKSIMRRNSILNKQTQDGLKLGDFYFDFTRGELRKGEQLVKMTSTELSLLRRFTEQPNTTISRYALCDAVGVNERSIDVQVIRLRRKIEPDPSSPRYLQTVWGEGYVLVPD